jgi:hypothetical protein
MKSRIDYPSIKSVIVDNLLKSQGRVRKLMVLILLVIGIVGRILLFDTPNIETVLIVSMLAGCLLGGIYMFLIPISVMFATDFCYMYFYGQGLSLTCWQNIFIFTWSGFVLVALVGYLLKEKRRFSLKFFGLFTGVGLLATLLFDVWTAFGWWFLFYPHTLSSLLLVYILQIPFTLRHMFSSFLFSVSLGFPLIYLYEKLTVMVEEKVKIAKPVVVLVPKRIKSRRRRGGVV